MKLPRALLFLLVSFSLFARERPGSSLVVAQLDPDIEKCVAQLRGDLSEEARGRIREELYALPSWQDRLAKTMAELAVQGRYDSSREPTEAEIAAEIGGRPYKGSPEEIREAFRKIVNSKFKSRAESARAKIYDITISLTRLKDDNTIRFIAPLLAERAEDMLGDDYGISPVQDRVVSVLWRAVEQGMKVPGLERPDSLRGWRQWWKENRHRYEPIPSALAAIEASEDGT